MCVVRMETDEERALLSQIDFESREQEDIRRSAEASGLLTPLLIERGAIPEVRIRIFTDPECFIGGHGKSHQEIFWGNGTPNPYPHPHFLRFLRHWINGPDLPADTVNGFRKIINDGLQDDEIEGAIKFAREEVRRLGLDPKKAREEFFRLTLECGEDVGDAARVREGVRTMKVR